MPLLNDAKTCYVGTTPITTIMAGSVQVWPKVPSIPGCYPPSSAIGFYSFEGNLKNSDGSAPDLQSVSLNALSTYEFVDGRFGKCVKRGYSTNVATDLSLVANITSVNRPLTLEAWLKVDDTIFKQWDSIEVKISSGDFQEQAANKLELTIFNGTNAPMEGRIVCRFGHNPIPTGGIATVSSTLGECGIIFANQWFHAAICCDMDGTNGKAWINGKFFKAKGGETPFYPGLPLENLGVRIVDSDNESHICVDELRLSKEIVYPDSNITPCA